MNSIDPRLLHETFLVRFFFFLVCNEYNHVKILKDKKAKDFTKF